MVFHDRELAAQCRAVWVPVHVIRLRSASDLSGPRKVGEVLASHGVQVAHVHGDKAAVNTALAPGGGAMVGTVHGQGEPTCNNPKAQAGQGQGLPPAREVVLLPAAGAGVLPHPRAVGQDDLDVQLTCAESRIDIAPD